LGYILHKIYVKGPADPIYYSLYYILGTLTSIRTLYGTQKEPKPFFFSIFITTVGISMLIIFFCLNVPQTVFLYIFIWSKFYVIAFWSRLFAEYTIKHSEDPVVKAYFSYFRTKEIKFIRACFKNQSKENITIKKILQFYVHKYEKCIVLYKLQQLCLRVIQV
jgi:hypothetical protein